MAKIALICKRLDEPVITLVDQLSLQKHEVFVITSKNESPPKHWKNQTLTYFNQWNVKESVLFFPHFLNLSVDIIHFTFSSDTEMPTSAHFLLAMMSRPLPRKILVLSYLDNAPSEKNLKLKAFIRTMDLITMSNYENLLSAKRQLEIPSSTVADILPPIIELSSLEAKHADQQLVKFSQKIKPYFVIPSAETELNISEFEFIHSKEISYNLVFLGDRNGKALKGHYILGAKLSNSEKLILLKNSKGLLLAFSNLSTLELQKWHMLASRAKCPILARPRQVNLYPGLVQENKSGWILEKGPHSLNSLLIENPELKLAQESFIKEPLHLTDSSMNELNRLYNEAYTHRWS